MFDLLGIPARLIDLCHTSLEVDTGLKGAEDVITCAEYTIEEMELLAQQLEDSAIGSVGLIDEVQDYDIVLLAVSVASAIRCSTRCGFHGRS